MFIYKVSKSSGKIVKLKNKAELFNNYSAYVRNPDKLPDTVHSYESALVSAVCVPDNHVWCGNLILLA